MNRMKSPDKGAKNLVHSPFKFTALRCEAEESFLCGYAESKHSGPDAENLDSKTNQENKPGCWCVAAHEVLFHYKFAWCSLLVTCRCHCTCLRAFSFYDFTYYWNYNAATESNLKDNKLKLLVKEQDTNVFLLYSLCSHLSSKEEILLLK